MITYHHDRLLAHIRGEKIAEIGNLTIMAQKQPAARKDTFQLLLINRRFDENPPVKQSPLNIDKTSYIRLHPHSFR